MTTGDERINSFAEISDLSDLKPKNDVKKKPTKSEVNKLATDAGFPSRQAPIDRRKLYRTGRNIQLNIKVTSKANEDFYALVDLLGVPLGAVFEMAVDALKATNPKPKK